jgi:hypothetical protein
MGWVLSARLLGFAGAAPSKPRPAYERVRGLSAPATLKYSPHVAKRKFRRRIFGDLMLSRIDYADWSG